MYKIILIVLSVLTVGCTAPYHQKQVESDRNLTVGTVQKEIKVGMSGADVASVLGSPNMVSTDSERREVWVYDKVATTAVQSSSSGWVFALIAGGSNSSGAYSKSQSTLTIIVKFDENKLVRDFAYHTSRF
jgi:outer membrane protein assembly factor BamE (lipoprotein component of BamABCDE complex)